MLRRNILKLVTELKILSTNEERLGETKKTIASREVVEKRADFLDQWVIPKCYLAFSALVADNQYANLGLMLLGSLARIKKIIQPLRNEVEDEKEDVDSKIYELSHGSGQLDLGEVIPREDVEMTNRVTRAKDEGEKDVDAGADTGADADVQRKKKKKKITTAKEWEEDAGVELTPPKPRKVKKKRKDYDEFDDLFGSLL